MPNESGKKWYSLALAFLIFLVILLFPTPEGLTLEGHRALAIFVLTVILWILRPISFAMSFFLIVSLLVILGVFKPESAFQGFGVTTIFFLIGAFILASAISKHGLHKRIALKLLGRFGNSPTSLVFGITFIAAFLSMAMPEHGVVALLIPVILGILNSSKRDLTNSNLSKALLLGLTYGASTGSMGTLLGGARAPLAISIYYEATGKSVSFLDWFIAAFPLALFMTVMVYIILKKFYPPEEVDMAELRRYLASEVKEMGPMSIGEKKALFFMVFAFVLWVGFGSLIGMATVAVLISALLGITGTLKWEDVEKKMPWGLIFLYAGAISLAFALVDTGAAAYVALGLISYIGGNPILAIFILVVLTVALSNFISNAATTAVILPIAISVLLAVGFSSVIGMYMVGMSSAFAFMFIVGTPGAALVYATGYLKLKDFLKPGLVLNIIGIIAFMTLGLAWWKFIGLW